jgi:hypothetical protein
MVGDRRQDRQRRAVLEGAQRDERECTDDEGQVAGVAEARGVGRGTAAVTTRWSILKRARGQAEICVAR